MLHDGLEALFKYAIALIVVIGCFILIYQGRGDSVQAWTVLGIVVGWIIRDSSGSAASSNARRVASAQPTTTVTAGPPATATVTPPEA